VSATVSKACTRCGVVKSLSEFALNRTRSEGRQAWCRSCFSAYEKMRSRSSGRSLRQPVSASSNPASGFRRCVGCQAVKPFAAFPDNILHPHVPSARCNDCWPARASR
jgi:hypothetical protein